MALGIPLLSTPPQNDKTASPAAMSDTIPHGGGCCSVQWLLRCDRNW